MVSISAIARPRACEQQQIRLTSPILHIGAAVSKLNPFEYVQTQDRVYLPNADALARVLQQRGRLQDYIEAIESQQEITPILKQAFGEDWKNQTSPDGNRIFPEVMTSRKWAKSHITDLRPMIRNGMGYFYIPGSSIKGAIRTAIVYYLLKHSDQYQVPTTHQVSEIELKLRERLKSHLSSVQQKFLDDDLLMNNLFTQFSLSYQGKSIPAKLGPNTDFLRALKVSDSTPLQARQITTKSGQPRTFNLAVVSEVLVSSHFENWKAKHRASIYAEMVRDVDTTFTLSLDTEMLSWFTHQQGMQIPVQSIADILKICQEFAQDQWDAEHDYWAELQNNPQANGRSLDFSDIRDLYEPENCPYSLRLGWGSGMNGTTIALVLKDEALKSNLRDVCGKEALNFEAPKSRRTIFNPKGEIRYAPGWTKFQPL